jgi:tetratricopeptide (TPR) repeat protein
MERSVFTEQGRLIGTPAYMSPEQAEMTGLNIDTTSDVYSLGVLMYELLVGALPFESKALLEAGLASMHRMIRDVDPPRPSTRLSTLGELAATIAQNRRTQPASLEKALRGELDWITMRAMEKDRTRRYPSAAEMGADIQRFLRDEAVLAKPPTAVYQMQKFAKRNKVLVGGAAAVLAVLVAGVAVSTWQAVRATRAERLAAERLVVAERERQKAQAVSRFLQDMLSSADPSRTRGRQVAVGEALDAAAKKVTDGFLKDKPDLEAEVQGTIGQTYVALGAHTQAGPYLRSSLETNERLHGPGSVETIGSLNRLAQWSYESGDIAAAESLTRVAVKTGRDSLGVHRAVAVSLNNLMKFVSEQGKPEGDSLMKEVLELDRKLFGENSLEAAKDLHMLGIMAEGGGRVAEAESLYRESIAMYTRLQGEDSPKTTFAMNTLGEFLISQGRSDEAKDVFQRNLEIRRRVLGPDHEETLVSLVNLGWAHRRAGDMAAAESCYKATFEGRKKAHGIDHPRTARVETQLADILVRRGAYEEAEPMFREALETRRKRLPARNIYIGTSLNKYGWLLLDRGRINEAEPMFVECLSIWNESLPETDLEIAEANAGMGGVLVERNRYVAAESLLVAGYEGMKSEPDAAPHRVRATLERLIRLSEHSGSANRSAEWRTRLAELPADRR